MIIFFWQNCISPHQVPYIRHVAKDCRVEKVYLIAPRVDYDERKNMGWNSELLTKETEIEVHICPDVEQIDKWMQQNIAHTVHLFSGIRGDYEVFCYFLQSLKYPLKRGFIIEPPYTYNKPLWAHYVRFFLQDRKFIRDFDYVFAIGTDAVAYYRKWSKHWKVVPFVYCTEQPCLLPELAPRRTSEILALTFVGHLCRRKNVKVGLKALGRLPAHIRVSFDIYGDGEQRASLEKIAQRMPSHVKVVFHGKVPMKEVCSAIQRHDILLLPSLYDGWGAVVNEALMCGLYVICSSRCGANLLLSTVDNGRIFQNNDSHDLQRIICDCYENRENIRQNRMVRHQWSQCIEGATVARYMVDNLKTSEPLVQPWSK